MNFESGNKILPYIFVSFVILNENIYITQIPSNPSAMETTKQNPSWKRVGTGQCLPWQRLPLVMFRSWILSAGCLHVIKYI